jgi:hypothetical protein
VDGTVAVVITTITPIAHSTSVDVTPFVQAHRLAPSFRR